MAIQPRTATVKIYGGDYLDRIRDLRRQTELAMSSDGTTPRRVGEKPEYMRLAEEHDALVQEAEAQATHVKLRALGRREWKTMFAEHPPRNPADFPEHNADGGSRCVCPGCTDRMLGVNEETFAEVLVPASILEPADLTEADLESLSVADFGQLYLAAFRLNRERAEDPKASLASEMIRLNSEISDSQND